MHNSSGYEWYIPKEYINAARDVMGSIDLDLAFSEEVTAIVQATKYFTAKQTGLKQKWTGRIYLNPPNIRDLLSKFSEVLIEPVKSFLVTGACVLVNNAIETSWFQYLAAHTSAICFLKGRVKFWTSDRLTSSPLQGKLSYISGRTQMLLLVCLRLLVLSFG